MRVHGNTKLADVKVNFLFLFYFYFLRVNDSGRRLITPKVSRKVYILAKNDETLFMFKNCLIRGSRFN